MSKGITRRMQTKRAILLKNGVITGMKIIDSMVNLRALQVSIYLASSEDITLQKASNMILIHMTSIMNNLRNKQRRCEETVLLRKGPPKHSP